MGQLASVTNALGETTNYGYDAFGRLASVGYGKVGSGNPTSEVGYTYGPEGNLVSVADSRAGTWTPGLPH